MMDFDEVFAAQSLRLIAPSVLKNSFQSVVLVIRFLVKSNIAGVRCSSLL